MVSAQPVCLWLGASRFYSTPLLMAQSSQT